MLIRLAARQSDLARIQAYEVGEALLSQNPTLQIEYHFRESLGDKNLQDPLWQMPDKGVFTQDFYDDLVNKRCDLVVHSWKDLSVIEQAQTHIAATLKRADSRDVLLLKRSHWQRVQELKSLVVLSSSPRRAHNLQAFLKTHLPSPLSSVTFKAVRGNVPTRLRRLLRSEPNADALIVAKAALDRLLTGKQTEFMGMKAELRLHLAECLWMLLPLQINPSAAAQGALAIEIRKEDTHLKKLLGGINCQQTFECALQERALLKNYGGGCHQKIGISVLPQVYGKVTSIQGLTEDGKNLATFALETGQNIMPKKSAESWPLEASDTNVFERICFKDVPKPQRPLWIAKAYALPESWTLAMEQPVWSSGLETWRKLAERGVWVNGSCEGLGEDYLPQVDTLAGHPLHWLKLSHSSGPQAVHESLATYQLVPKNSFPDLSGKSNFFWMSASLFEVAIKVYPWLLEARCQHACGPGNTAHALRKHLRAPQKGPLLYLSYEHWRQDVLKNGASHG